MQISKKKKKRGRERLDEFVQRMLQGVKISRQADELTVKVTGSASFRILTDKSALTMYSIYSVCTCKYTVVTVHTSTVESQRGIFVMCFFRVKLWSK